MKLGFLQLYKNRFSVWWNNLSAKDRRYVSILAVFLVIVGGYYGVIQPTNDAIAAKQQAIAYQQAMLDSIQPQIAAIKNLKSSMTQTSPISKSALLATVDQNLKENNLDKLASDLSQTADSGVQIKFNAISFDRLSDWLVSLWQKYHIQVSRIEIQRDKNPGKVSVLLTLSTS